MNYNLPGKTNPLILDTVTYIRNLELWLDRKGGHMVNYTIYETGQISFNIIPPHGVDVKDVLPQFEKEYTNGRST